MDEQLRPYFTAVEASKARVAAARQTQKAAIDAATAATQPELDAAIAQNKSDGENLVTAVKTVYEVQ
jgi:hypothetical protein